MSLTATLNGFARAMRVARFLILILVLVAGAGLYAVSAVVNAVNYTKVRARVERVSLICRPGGAPVAEAVECAYAPPPAAAGGKVIRNAAVYVKYTSPADGREHRGRIVATGKSQFDQIRDLRPGDVWTIWAHDDEPDTIKRY